MINKKLDINDVMTKLCAAKDAVTQVRDLNESHGVETEPQDHLISALQDELEGVSSMRSMAASRGNPCGAVHHESCMALAKQARDIAEIAADLAANSSFSNEITDSFGYFGARVDEAYLLLLDANDV